MTPTSPRQVLYPWKYWPAVRTCEMLRFLNEMLQINASKCSLKPPEVEYLSISSLTLLYYALMWRKCSLMILSSSFYGMPGVQSCNMLQVWTVLGFLSGLSDIDRLWRCFYSILSVYKSCSQISILFPLPSSCLSKFTFIIIYV